MQQTKRHFPENSILRPRKLLNETGEKESGAEGKGKSAAKGRLGSQAVLLLVVNGLFAVANALSGTFVNIYLWKIKNDLALIGWFALANQAAMSITIWIAGKWVKEHNKMNSLRLGVFVSAAFYFSILLLGKRSVDFVLPLGAVQGMSAAFFWLAFNVVYFEITDRDNRDSFNGWSGLLASAGMMVPWIAGLLISRMPDTQGYTVIFSISLVIFLLGVVVSFFLKKRKAQENYEWFHAYRQLADKSSDWRRICSALAAQGIREGVFGFVIGLLVYIATNNEMQLGNYALITSTVALISYWLIGKYLKPGHRSLGMLIGTVMLVLFILPFFWQVNYSTLLIFGIGTALVFPLYIIPMVSSVFDIIGKDRESATLRVEYVVLRELALSSGRIFGTLMFIVVVSLSRSPLVLSSMLLFIGSTPFVAWLLMRKLLNVVHQVDKSK